MNKTTTFFVDLVQQITLEISIPTFFWLLIELVSNLQIISLALLPLLHKIPSAQNRLSSTINYLISYLELFRIFDPFDSEATVMIILTLCGIYFLSYFSIIAFLVLNKTSKNSQFNQLLSKLMSFMTIFHSKILFYFIHCFTMRAVNSNTTLCSNGGSFSCTALRIVFPAIFIVLNASMTSLQELFCYQIHQNKHPYGIKNNLHHFVRSIHKGVVISLFYFFNDTPKLLIFFTVTFTIVDLFILHSRLPFYDLKMLKFAIILSTISAFSAVVTISLLFNAREENLCLFIIITVPLLIKISLMKLRTTLWSIFTLKSMKPFQIVHLPILIENFFDKNSVLPLPNSLTKSTLYSMSFLASDLEKTPLASGNNSYATEINKAAYSKAVDQMTKISQKYPKNEILPLAISQIYSQTFEDSFKALDIINKIPETENQSFAGRVSFQTILQSLSTLSQDSSQTKDQERSSHLSYFAYRHKTSVFKKRIKQEIEDHLKLWKTFSNNELDVLSTVAQASKISPYARSINDYWHSNFEGYEVVYVNAALMYGLYLEIVHAIPHGGYSYIKKAYSSITSKWHIQRDVMDVVLGNSAVVVASIEPDKIGKVIDASSSVKQLFGMTKQALIGSNIGMVMPNLIAMKHNDFIRGFQKFFNNDINHSIASYAKTLQDEYFKVQVTLHISPLTHKGLNLVAYIRKMSEHQPLMIVDSKGNIIEYSKDLAFTFNLFTKRGYVKIETLCPAFQKINQAFATLYSDEANNDTITVKQQSQPVDTMMPPVSPSHRRLISSPREDEFFLSKNLLLTEKTATETPYPMVGSQNNMTIEEAQEIWESCKQIKEFVYCPCDQSNAEVKYKTEIEPFLFDKKWYKIVKIKNLNSSNNEKTASRELRMVKAIKHQIIDPPDEFADIFPNDEEKTENDSSESQRNPITIHRHQRHLTTQMASVAKQSASNNFAELTSLDDSGDPEEINIQRYSIKSKKSVVTSQASQKITSQKLANSLKIEKQSPSSKLVITLVYLAVTIIIISICTHLIYTKDSLTEMQSSISLTRLVNTRLAKTVLNWQAMLVLYSRAVKLRPVDWKVPLFQATSIAACQDVLQNAQELAQEIDKFQKKEIVESLYAKTVGFWEPLDGSLFNGGPIDQFSANQVLLAYYLELARYDKSYLNLAGSREFLFSINNTANDYLLTLDRSISNLAEFFTDTKNTNVKLLKVITAIEILAVLSPLILLFVVLSIVIKTYSKLFFAICKINEQSLAKRVQQLEDFSHLFEQNIEDEVSPFQKFKSQGVTVKDSIEKKQISVKYSRAFKIKSLVVCLLRYIFVAALFILIIIIFVALSLSKSVADLENLDTISSKAGAVYNVGSQIRSLLPSFYDSILFYNATSYKIRNKSPGSQLALQLETLDDANNILVSTLVDSNGVISDPIIKDILNGNICKYVQAQYQVNCFLGTKGYSYGLLGFNAFYTQTCRCMKDWLNNPHPTWTWGASLTTTYINMNNNTHFALFDAYDYLTNYLVGTFLDSTEESKSEIQSMFYQNIAAVLVSMFLIRVFVITKLQVFDLGIRRILRIIPYKIIEENKVMSMYLNKTFQDELKVLKQCG